MNRVKIEMSQTFCPKQFESKKYGIELEGETLNGCEEECNKLFGIARNIIQRQKDLDIKK